MRMVHVLIILAAVLLAAPLAADERSVALRDDPRLQAKVTLSVGCEPVSILAEILKKATGVSITVRKDIADLNVTAYAGEMPVCEAMSRVALALDCSWELRGDSPDKHAYTLFRPLKKKQEAEDLRQAYWNEQDRKFRDAIEAGIRMVNADPKTLQEEARKNPGQVMMNITFRDTLQDLACFTKAQRDDIWARIAASPLAEIRIPFTELPSSLQERFRKQLDERHERSPDRNPSSEGIEKRELIISRGGGYGSPRLSGVPLESRLAFFGIPGIGGTAGLGAVSADKQLTDRDRKTLQEAGIGTSFIKPFSAEFADSESKAKRVKIEWPGEDEKEQPAPVGFVLEGRRNSPWHSFNQVLEAASKMFEISIFAPDYICRHKNCVSLRTTLPDDVEEALNEICREFDYEISFDKDGCVVLECKTWYIDEARETPKRLVLRWMDAKKKQGKLQFKDYLEITRELNNFRIEALAIARIDGENPLSREVMHMSSHTDRIRLASMLTADQMKQTSLGGLTYSRMKSDQQQHFAYLLCCERPDLTILEMHTCLFGIQETPGVKERTRPDEREVDRVTFTFTYGPEDRQEFTMELPKAD